ncbi:GtrA family protein [Neorhizobium sp. BT27B]|uniref:GtrA family protein n=1 Tax=Neorhizobium sp. BT27B TaxID=3142625 RepID=UPI003D289A25
MNGLVRQLVRFGLVGLVNTSVGLLAIYALMYVFQVSPGFANAGGYALGLCISFLLNRDWTFQDNSKICQTLPRYLAVAAVCYSLNLAIVLSAVHMLGIDPYVAQLLGIVAYTACMFVGCRLFVFGARTSHTNTI